MSAIRPKILLNQGRVQMPLRVDITDLLVGDPIKTIISADAASASGSITVKNGTGFTTGGIAGDGKNLLLLIGEPGTQQAEFIKGHASTAATTTVITLATNTVFAHSSSTSVYLLPFDQIEFSRATTATGAKSVISGPTTILANQRFLEFSDVTNTSGFYFARFKETITNTFSAYSDYVQYAGYTVNSARAIIKAALHEINKNTSEVLSDEFFFTELDMCQSEVLHELKRWSFMQKFDSIIGQLATGNWRIAVPTDQDDQNTFKSVYDLRIGTKHRLVMVDKQKFDEFLDGVAYTTLAANLTVGQTTITLTDSSDFNTTSGTVDINGNTYTFTANNTTTNVLTISTTVDATNTATSGDFCFSGESTGLPHYVTTYGGFFYFYPVVSSTYTVLNLYEDYYTAQVQITADNTNVIFPDPSVAIYYLCWKSLKKLNNGGETAESLSYKTLYEERKKIMKNKEVLGKTFKMRPRIQNFATQTKFNSGDSKSIRIGNFANTGF